MSVALLPLFLLAIAQNRPWPSHPIAPGSVKGVDGISYQIPARNSKATVVLFVTVDCPIGNRYAPEIDRIVSKYGDRVAFFLAYTDPSFGVSAIKKHRKD